MIDPYRPRQTVLIPRSALAERYESIRQRTLDLAAPLFAEGTQVQSMPDASPAKRHLAHITWCFETFVLKRFEAPFRPFGASFRQQRRPNARLPSE